MGAGWDLRVSPGAVHQISIAAGRGRNFEAKVDGALDINWCAS